MDKNTEVYLSVPIFTWSSWDDDGEANSRMFIDGEFLLEELKPFGSFECVSLDYSLAKLTVWKEDGSISREIHLLALPEFRQRVLEYGISLQQPS